MQNFATQQEQYKQYKDLEDKESKIYTDLGKIINELTELKEKIQNPLSEKYLIQSLLEKHNQVITKSEKNTEQYRDYFLAHQKALNKRLIDLNQVKLDISTSSSLSDNILARIAGLGLFIADNNQNFILFKNAVASDKKTECITIINEEIAMQSKFITKIIDGAENILRKMDEVRTVYHNAEVAYSKEVLSGYHKWLSGIFNAITEYRKSSKFILKSIFTLGMHAVKIKKSQADIMRKLEVVNKEKEINENVSKDLINSLVQRKEKIKFFLMDIVESFSNIDINKGFVKNNRFIYLLADLGSYLKSTCQSKDVEKIQQEISKMISDDADFKEQIVNILKLKDKDLEYIDMIGSLFVARKELTEEIAEQENINPNVMDNLKILGENLYIFSKFIGKDDINKFNENSVKSEQLIKQLMIPMTREYCGMLSQNHYFSKTNKL